MVIILVDVKLFRRDWIPLLWHVQHGFHAELNGIRFKVPILYDEDHGAQPNTLAFWKFPGYFSAKSSSITIQTRNDPIGAKFGGSSGFNRTEHAAALVGKQGNCVEYIWKDGATLMHSADDGPAYIYCDFGEHLYASFSGTLSTKDEFYAFLQNAELVDRKN